MSRSLVLLLPAILVSMPLMPLPRAVAQDEENGDAGMTEAEETPVAPGSLVDVAPVPGAEAPPSSEQARQAADLIAEAITLAERNASARVTVTRSAAALLPRLEGERRRTLTDRWIRIAMSGNVPRHIRANAFSSFFDVASRTDIDFTRAVAMSLPDAAARAGGFLALSEATTRSDWHQSTKYTEMAQQAARREPQLLPRARALIFIAHRLVLNRPERAEAAIVEASSHTRQLRPSRERDSLLAEVVGAAAKYDLALARRIAGDISEPGLQGLAAARINLAEISQTSLTSTTSDRIAALAKAAAPYDIRAVPILLQLPADPEVLKAIADALPAIRATSQAPVSVSLLERMWDYASRADASSYRDQLQSRLARLMVLQDLWRGRAWGKRLPWQGGRIQVGAFLHSVAAARRSGLRAAPLQDLAERSVSRAIFEARTMPPAARAEALLLIAGQVLR